MSVAQFTIRARGQSFPVTIVSAQTAFYQGIGPQWNVVAPDPGALNANDIVLVHAALQNAKEDLPLPSGWQQLLYSTAGANDEYASILYGRRVSSPGTLPANDRTWLYFTNFATGSFVRLSIVVLRGVPGGDLISFFSARTGSIVNGTLGAPAALTSHTRPAAVSLSLHFVHTAAGSISAAPAGWTSVLEAVDGAGTDAGSYYVEAAQYAESGTTTALARTTSPLRRATALISLVAQ